MKTAVITGAASGIGLALTLTCLKKGLTVMMVDKDQSKLDLECQSLLPQFPEQVLSYCCDVTNTNQVNELARFTEKQLNRVDYLYNNAGIIGALAPVWDLTHEQISQVMDINLFGMINIIRAFSPILFQQNFRSHIINMASLYALSSGSQMASYAMSKHAVLALSESLYFDLKRLDKPVDVSIVFPSFTDTGLLSRQSDTHSPFQEALNQLLSHSRPAMDVAEHIVREVEQKQFYILPDKEVKGYCEERTQAIIAQENPHVNNIEKLMGALIKRKNSERR